jgi:hypothetical protein
MSFKRSMGARCRRLSPIILAMPAILDTQETVTGKIAV